MTVIYKIISALYVKIKSPKPNQNDVIHLCINFLGAITIMKYFQANITSNIIGKLLRNAYHWSSCASLFFPKIGVKKDYLRSLSAGGYLLISYGIT